MRPKEKALELLGKYIQFTPVEYEYEYAKKCALISVDEILNLSKKNIIKGKHIPVTVNDRIYWENVKQEIEKI